MHRPNTPSAPPRTHTHIPTIYTNTHLTDHPLHCAHTHTASQYTQKHTSNRLAAVAEGP